ncbi:hypothetical protein E2562_004186 [Oryza meyeriana var. granulata]|uniref:Uncharacterized protein n=1 Tax=Oryza meyeriana var. granulata TaxID=110450 RepID=A0A6G1BSF9_9ORYZ|nr:hypothetical protein E2562_004186 [Oryza meyeriana var. granulata]
MEETDIGWKCLGEVVSKVEFQLELTYTELREEVAVEQTTLQAARTASIWQETEWATLIRLGRRCQFGGLGGAGL